MTHKFSCELDKLLKSPDFESNVFYHYTTLKPHKRANAAYLMGAFQVIILGKSAEDAWKGFRNLTTFVTFRDASFSGSTFQLPILNCLKALENAIKYNWYDYKTFDMNEYEHYGKFENGDITWILPNRLLAFSSPSSTSNSDKAMIYTPEDYSSIFKKIGVTAVIRLNSATYEATVSNM